MAIIYKITNKVNHKTYIGFTTSTLEKRWQSHCYNAKSGNNGFFSRAIRKYGASAFFKEVITESDNIDFLLKIMETAYVTLFNSNDTRYGYNMTQGGEGAVISKEVRKQWSESRRGSKNSFFGKKHSLDTINQISISKTGKKHSDTTRSKMSQSRCGKLLSDAHRQKISESMKKFHQKR